MVPVKTGTRIIEIWEWYCCFAFLLDMEILQMVAWLQWTVCSELCRTLIWSIPCNNNSLFHGLFWEGKLQTIRLLFFFFFSILLHLLLTFSSFTHVIRSAHAALLSSEEGKIWISVVRFSSGWRTHGAQIEKKLQEKP